MSTAESVRALRRAVGDAGTMARFWAHVAPGADGCREWAGTVGGDGRPAFLVGGVTLQPKRIAWSALRGELAAGGKMVPVCWNPRCVEPAHMVWRIQGVRLAG